MISSTFDKNKVFTVMWSEIEGRIDCGFYKPEYNSVVKKIKSKKHIKLGNLVEFVNSSWDQKSIYKDKFPYIEIGTVNLIDGSITSIKQVEVKNAPSRAKKVVYSGDVIVSATRPSRGAVVLINKDQDKSICSTGFIVLRDIKNTLYNKKTLQLLLRTSFVLKQCEQRQSGGNYPAITESEYKKIIVPTINDAKKIELILSIWDRAINDRIEKLSQAEELLKSIDTYLLSELNLQLPELKNDLADRKYIVNSKEVISSRFDAKSFSKYRMVIQEELNKSTLIKYRLKDLITSNIGGDWGKEVDDKTQDDTICLVMRSTEFDNKYNLNFDEEKFAFRAISNKTIKKMSLQNGDIIVEKSGGSSDQPVGRVAYIERQNYINYPLAYSNFLTKISINTNLVDSYYLFEYLRFIYRLKLTDYMQNQTNGIRNLIISEFMNQVILVPYNHQAIGDKIKTIKEKAKQCELEAQQCIDSARAKIEQTILGD